MDIDDLRLKMMGRHAASCLLLCPILFSLSFNHFDLVSSSAADRKASERKNLLKNGLGLTPPMGYLLPLSPHLFFSKQIPNLIALPNHSFFYGFLLMCD